jgi:hypothetical protein
MIHTQLLNRRGRCPWTHDWEGRGLVEAGKYDSALLHLRLGVTYSLSLRLSLNLNLFTLFVAHAFHRPSFGIWACLTAEENGGYAKILGLHRVLFRHLQKPSPTLSVISQQVVGLDS